jgi:hypothetical protein
VRVEALMRWYRSNRKLVGSLALFALAMQMTLSFGHIHPRDFAGVPGVATAQAQATPSDSGGGNGTGHSTNDYCLVCANTNLAGTLLLPDLIVLEVPVGTTDASHPHVCTAICSNFNHALFRARAPPLA